MIQQEQNAATALAGKSEHEHVRDVGLRELAREHVARPGIGEAPRLERGDRVQVGVALHALDDRVRGAGSAIGRRSVLPGSGLVREPSSLAMRCREWSKRLTSLASSASDRRT